MTPLTGSLAASCILKAKARAIEKLTCTPSGLLGAEYISFAPTTSGQKELDVPTQPYLNEYSANYSRRVTFYLLCIQEVSEKK